MSKVSALSAALGVISERTAKTAGDHRGAGAIHAEVGRMRTAGAALAQAYASRSPLVTPAAHTKKLADMARKYDREVLAGLNRASDALRSARADIQRRIDDKISLKEDAYGTETRAYFRTLNRTDKMSLISELIGENRGPELAALLKAPRSATGLTKDEVTRLESQLYSTHAADEMAELALVEEVHSGAIAAYEAGTDLARSLTDPGELARIESEDAAANDAGAAFDQALAAS
jgi:hypothetical protein